MEGVQDNSMQENTKMNETQININGKNKLFKTSEDCEGVSAPVQYDQDSSYKGKNENSNYEKSNDADSENLEQLNKDALK